MNFFAQQPGGVIVDDVSSRWVVLAAMVSALLSATPARASVVTSPPGLKPGDWYRLVFITSTGRDARSSEIGDYNAFVTDVANSQGELAALETTWTAIVSTASVFARGNTNTETTATGVPIFRLDGALVADGNMDLWDGSIQALIQLSESGSSVGGQFVWTGSFPWGTPSLGSGLGGLGTECVDLGYSGNIGYASGWMYTGCRTDVDTSRPFYAMSGLLQMPEPSTSMLVGLSLAGLAVRRRARQAQIRP